MPIEMNGLLLPEPMTVRLVVAGPDQREACGFVLSDQKFAVRPYDGVNTDQTGRTIAHDIMDHGISQGQTLLDEEDELWAVGAAFWMCGPNGTYGAPGLSADLTNTILGAEGMRRAVFGPDMAPPAYAVKAIDVVRDECLKNFEQELEGYYDHCDSGEFTYEDFLYMAKGGLDHIAWGYHAAREFYQDVQMAFTVRTGIENEVKRLAESHDFESEADWNRGLDFQGPLYGMILEIDFASRTVKGRSVKPRDEESWVLDKQIEKEEEALCPF